MAGQSIVLVLLKMSVTPKRETIWLLVVSVIDQSFISFQGPEGKHGKIGERGNPGEKVIHNS